MATGGVWPFVGLGWSLEMWAGGGAVFFVPPILVDGDSMARGIRVVQALHVAPQIDWSTGRELPEIDEAVGA